MTERLDAIEIETGPRPAAAVLWMHGLGADGSDFAPIVPELAPLPCAVRFVFPHAPLRPVTVNAGYVMRAWYDIASLDVDRREDEAGVRASHALLATLVEREGARGIAAARVVLAGFSQGGAMALFTGLRGPERLAGIVALSCYVPVADALGAEAHPANRETPIFMAHGTEDPVVPLRLGARSRDRLVRMGHRVEWHEYPMPHAVCPEEIADISAWLAGALA
ncbi:MAG: alpha/beta hydrolase [Burkholderiales bacterium]|nr:alpha/beta hydrolase [Burkholderiales bacterium]